MFTDSLPVIPVSSGKDVIVLVLALAQSRVVSRTDLPRTSSRLLTTNP